jgi:hypothetical protein
MAAQNLETIVKELKDRDMIKELTHQYAHYVRQNDVEGLVALFAEDGTVEMDPTIFSVAHLSRIQAHPVHGAMAVTPTVFIGRDGLRRFYAETLPKLGTSYHFLHNPVIRLQGDRATGVWSVEIRGVRGEESVIGAGHYDDEYTRIDEEWRFQRRKITLYYFVGHREGWGGERFTVKL